MTFIFNGICLITSNKKIIVHGELGRKWKEAVMICFKALSQHLPGWTMENHEKSVRIANI
jgi:hypothetical protein